MKAASVIAIALASAVGGAAMTGWVISSGKGRPPPGLMASNVGYTGPAGVPEGAPPGNLPWPGVTLSNPYGNSPSAIAQGKRMFSAMNCAGCHGYTGAGGMGPPLDDSYWRYGGSPVEIYKSIYEGRPKGMPAWGVALPPSEIWALTAYVTSLGGGKEASNIDPSRGSNSQGSSANDPKQSAAGIEGQ